ncbi:hypothetical protein VNO78_32837 [Psophocarpus tetragonolobus]|uniref:C2H2-type domain-containing protein n=1 Tax=Psophocarpus tetragonolobus TaxID=3891 RepID=A0AAN9RPQ2_PSOTE
MCAARCWPALVENGQKRKCETRNLTTYNWVYIRDGEARVTELGESTSIWWMRDTRRFLRCGGMSTGLGSRTAPSAIMFLPWHLWSLTGLNDVVQSMQPTSLSEMPIAKLKASGTPDVMKTEDRIDTIIRQAIGKEPFVSFPRASDSPVQWIQLLHALDPQGVSNSFSEFPGWPLLSPLKVQLQKCEKCSREFCSPINYRRHIRVHHRFKKLDKDFTKTRDLLGAYWDKLSLEEAKEVVSFENVVLEEVSGSSILKSLTTLIQNQGFYSFPQYYLMAGAALLDIVQSKPSSFPISSQELFSVLDDASEKTCLCGTAESMQRYVFDGEAGKIGLEPKNLVACTSFLLEQKLVKAWLADKDAEALRCQKQLVEEEEAAQKRQAEILERKRQKKLRQKEQKAREQRDKAESETKGNIDSTVKGALSLAEASLDTYNFEACNPNTFSDTAASAVPFQCLDAKEEINGDPHLEYDSVTDQNIERRSAHGHKPQRLAVARQQGLPKLQWAVANGFHTNQNSPMPKLEVLQKHGTHCDLKASAIVNGSKVWSRKSKTEIDKVVLKTIKEKELDEAKNQEVLIGSISVNLGNCSSQSEGNMVTSQKDCMVENVGKQNSSLDKPDKTDIVISGNNRPTVKLWRPVNRLESKDPLPVQSGLTEVDAVHGDDQNMSSPSSLRVSSTDGGDIGFEKYFSHPDGRADPVSFQFDIQAAKAFLAQRWKEAISSDHVTLVVCPDPELSGCEEIQDIEIAACQSSDVDSCNIVANADNRLPATFRVAKSKPRLKKFEKGTMIKYIPKQKTNT